MGTYRSSTAKSIIRGYRTDLERMKYDCNKNFNQMDFENADAKNDMQEHVDSIINSCETLLSELSNYSFK